MPKIVFPPYNPIIAALTQGKAKKCHITCHLHSRTLIWLANQHKIDDRPRRLSVTIHAIKMFLFKKLCLFKAYHHAYNQAWKAYVNVKEQHSIERNILSKENQLKDLELNLKPEGFVLAKDLLASLVKQFSLLKAYKISLKELVHIEIIDDKGLQRVKSLYVAIKNKLIQENLKKESQPISSEVVDALPTKNVVEMMPPLDLPILDEEELRVEEEVVVKPSALPSNEEVLKQYLQLLDIDLRPREMKVFLDLIFSGFSRNSGIEFLRCEKVKNSILMHLKPVQTTYAFDGSQRTIRFSNVIGVKSLSEDSVQFSGVSVWAEGLTGILKQFNKKKVTVEKLILKKASPKKKRAKDSLVVQIKIEDSPILSKVANLLLKKEVLDEERVKENLAISENFVFKAYDKQ